MRSSLRTSKSFGEFMLQEYMSRRERNQSYSYRAFARDTGISVSHLSDIFQNYNGVSYKTAEKIALKLKWTSQELELAWQMIQRDFSKSSVLREAARKRVAELLAAEANILDRLRETGVIQKTTDGIEMVQNKHSLKGESASWLHQMSREFLKKAQDGIEMLPSEKRFVSTDLCAINSEQYPVAIEAIERFVQKFNDDFGSGAVSGSIYVLSLQFFDVLDSKFSQPVLEQVAVSVSVTKLED